MKRLFAATLLMLLWRSCAWAAIDVYQFDTEQERDRYQVLTKELRCPKCQNQDIADSNAPIAQDLRREVHRMLGEGQSDEQIIQYMKDRYGDFVVYKPRFDATTAVLWLGPLAVGILGLIVILILAFRSSHKPAPAEPLSSDERAKLDQLLNDRENP